MSVPSRPGLTISRASSLAYIPENSFLSIDDSSMTADWSMQQQYSTTSPTHARPIAMPTTMPATTMLDPTSTVVLACMVGAVAFG